MARFTDDILASLVEFLCAEARAGRPCPSNDRICGRFGARSPATAARMVQIAEQQGLIVVQRGMSSRVVAAPDGSWRTAGTVTQRDAAFLTEKRGAARAPRPPRPPNPRKAQQIEAVRAALAIVVAPSPKPFVRHGNAVEPPRVEATHAPVAPRATGRTCLWPMWHKFDRPGPTPLFCGAARDGGRLPYCAVHHARATVSNVKAARGASLPAAATNATSQNQPHPHLLADPEISTGVSHCGGSFTQERGNV